jgi:hypothetical protein
MVADLKEILCCVLIQAMSGGLVGLYHDYEPAMRRRLQLMMLRIEIPCVRAKVYNNLRVVHKDQKTVADNENLFSGTGAMGWTTMTLEENENDRNVEEDQLA